MLIVTPSMSQRTTYLIPTVENQCKSCLTSITFFASLLSTTTPKHLSLSRCRIWYLDNNSDEMRQHSSFLLKHDHKSKRLIAMWMRHHSHPKMSLKIMFDQSICINQDTNTNYYKLPKMQYRMTRIINFLCCISRCIQGKGTYQRLSNTRTITVNQLSN